MTVKPKDGRIIGPKPAPIVASEPPKLPTGELPAGMPQVIVINGVTMVMLPKADYDVLIEAARDNIEDLADAADAIDILRRIESGEEEALPFDLVNRITRTDETGESRIKILREHRGLTQAQLGEKIDSDRLYVSQLETGVRKGSIDILQKIAAALDVPVDLVLPKPAAFNIDSLDEPIRAIELGGLAEEGGNADQRSTRSRSHVVYGHDPRPPKIGRSAATGVFVPVDPKPRGMVTTVMGSANKPRGKK